MELSLKGRNFRVSLDQRDGVVAESIEITLNDTATEILRTEQGFSALQLWSQGVGNSKTYTIVNQTEEAITLKYEDQALTIILEYRVEEGGILHVIYTIRVKRKLKLTKCVSSYEIPLGQEPDFTWVPHLRPKENFVMGDHVFRSPAIIYQKGSYGFILIPDLDLLGRNRPKQAFLDLNLLPDDSGKMPRVQYGFGNYSTKGHIMFKHDPQKCWKISAGTDLSFGYYVIPCNEKNPITLLQRANTFLWERYGMKKLHTSLAPQVISYDRNALEGFSAITDRHKIWGDFVLNGEPCGGFWQTSWLGKRKSKVKFADPATFNLEDQMKENMTLLVSEDSLLSRIIMHFSNSPFWIKRFAWFTQTFPVIKRNAEVWFNAWFNNMRSAYGFRYFGEIWERPDLVEKGDRILHTFLSTPRVRGASPSVILPACVGGPTEISTIKGLQGFFYVDDYSLVDVCLTSYWALKYTTDFGTEMERVTENARQLFNLLAEIQLENGEIPAYVDFKPDEDVPLISEILKGSASSGAHLMFLVEFYKSTGEQRVLSVAERVARFLEREIIPEDKWHDFEPFYSCTHLPLDFYDEYTRKHAMNGLCIYWCAEGMKELYRITEKSEYLQAGEHALSILSLFQQVWDAPYISFNTFGGFCSQNVDAELSDARQGLFVRVYLEYYVITGKREYFERGIAALRGSWAMQLLTEYATQCPGNVEGLKTADSVDRGIVFENYGHSGHDLRVPGYWMADWGFGTSVTATAYVKKHFGDLYIDFDNSQAFGIDGVLVKAVDFVDESLQITCEFIPDKKQVIVMGRLNEDQSPNLIISGKSIGVLKKVNLEKGISICVDDLTE